MEKSKEKSKQKKQHQSFFEQICELDATPRTYLNGYVGPKITLSAFSHNILFQKAQRSQEKKGKGCKPK